MQVRQDLKNAQDLSHSYLNLEQYIGQELSVIQRNKKQVLS